MTPACVQVHTFLHTACMSGSLIAGVGCGCRGYGGGLLACQLENVEAGSDMVGRGLCTCGAVHRSTGGARYASQRCLPSA